VKNLAGDGKHLNRPLQLELYRSENFIGYFVKDDDENVLKRLALNFVKEVSDSSKLLIRLLDSGDGLLYR
jgi:hypothetical protein